MVVNESEAQRMDKPLSWNAKRVTNYASFEDWRVFNKSLISPNMQLHI